MTPIKFVGIWIIQFISFFIIFSVSYILLPEVYLFHLYSDSVSFITESDWDALYLISMMVASVLINAVLIYATVLIAK